MYSNPKTSTTDFWFVHNNGVVAMRPNPNGRFSSMVLEQDGKHQAWVFKDAFVFEGRPVQLELLIAHGSMVELDELNAWLVARDLTWDWCGDASSSFVPFSNGCRKYEQRKNGTWLNDYEDYEYAQRRVDSPRMAIEAFVRALELVK
jgi:hypothetical protein